MKKYCIESRTKGISYIQLKKANWTGHILCRKYLLKCVIEGMTDIRIDIMGRRRRRRGRSKQLQDDLKKRQILVTE
jgi:hypothetical protein